MDPLIHMFKGKRVYLYTAILFSILITIASLWSILGDRFQVVRDEQNFYWMARFQDPALFPNDRLLGFQVVDLEILGRVVPLHPPSLGYGLLFYVASFFVDHIWLNKYLVFALMPLSVLMLFKIGKTLQDEKAGFYLSLMFAFFITASFQSSSIGSGLQRAFALPLLIAFLYYRVQNNFVGMSALIVISASIYIPISFVITGAVLLSAVKIEMPPELSWRIPGKKIWVLIASLIVLVMILFCILSVNGSGLQVNIFDFIKDQQRQEMDVIAEDPQYQPGGIAPLYLSYPLLGRAGVLETGTEAIIFFTILLIDGMMFLVLKNSSRPQNNPFSRMKEMIVASLFLYAASLVLILRFNSMLLYYPSRYIKYTLFFLVLLYAGLNWDAFINEAGYWAKRNLKKIFIGLFAVILGGAAVVFAMKDYPLFPLIWLSGVITAGVLAVLAGGAGINYILNRDVRKMAPWMNLVFLAVLGLSILMGGVYIDTLGMVFINPDQAERDMYTYIKRNLPKDVMVAGDPVIMNRIPLFSERDVLFREIQPTDGQIERVMDYFEAQFSESVQPVYDFCDRYQVDYLVVDEQDFKPASLETGDQFYPSYQSDLLEIIGEKKEFGIVHLPAVYESGSLKLIDCQP